jgi:hypothetical protein
MKKRILLNILLVIAIVVLVGVLLRQSLLIKKSPITLNKLTSVSQNLSNPQEQFNFKATEISRATFTQEEIGQMLKQVLFGFDDKAHQMPIVDEKDQFVDEAEVAFELDNEEVLFTISLKPEESSDEPEILSSFSVDKILRGSFSKAEAKEYLIVLSQHFPDPSEYVVGSWYLMLFTEAKKLVSAPIKIIQSAEEEWPRFSSINNFVSFKGLLPEGVEELHFYPCQGINYLFVSNEWLLENNTDNVLPSVKSLRLWQVTGNQSKQFTVVQEVPLPTPIQEKWGTVANETAVSLYKYTPSDSRSENFECSEPQCLSYLPGGGCCCCPELEYYLFWKAVPFNYQTCRFDF